MLKGIDPLLNADVLYALRAMGHGDEIVLADANFPAEAVARETVLGEVLRIDAPVARAARAVLSLMPLDDFEPGAATRMEVVGDADAVPPVAAEVQAEIDAAAPEAGDMAAVERFAFYDRARGAFAVLQTTERRFYGCFVLRKGVVEPGEE